MAKKIKQAVPEFPKVIETMSKPYLGAFITMRDEPSAMNGNVSVRKYRITIEEIPEPIEVIHARLEQLWLECDNWHHWTPLENAAKQYNYEFKGERGSLKKQRT